MKNNLIIVLETTFVRFREVIKYYKIDGTVYIEDNITTKFDVREFETH